MVDALDLSVDVIHDRCSLRIISPESTASHAVLEQLLQIVRIWLGRAVFSVPMFSARKAAFHDIMQFPLQIIPVRIWKS